MTALELVAAALVLAASFFNVVAVLGYIRLPDVFSRMHAAGLAATFGVVLLMLMCPLVLPVGFGKVLLLCTLLIIAAPVASHAIASAALHAGERQRSRPGKPPPPDALFDQRRTGAP